MSKLRGRVLLLNADYSVLGTVGVARAIRLQIREEHPVQILETVPDCYLNNDVKYPVPSVMCLKNFVNIRKNREDSGSKREKVYLRDGYKCQYCGIGIGKMFVDEFKVRRMFTKKDLTWDHITPSSKGGSSHHTNLVTACKKCNQRKADRTPEEARMPLLTKTKKMNQAGMANVMLCKYVEHRPEWLPYLEAKDGFLEVYEQYREMLAVA